MQVLRVLTVLLGIVFLSACSGSKPVKTYEGERLAENQHAVLKAGENITVISVNGKPVTKYLLTNIEVDYALKPGPNTVVFQYRSTWAQASRGEDTPRATEVSSEKLQVSLTAQAGDRLAFKYDEAENVREAQALAENFRAEVVNQTGKGLAMSQAYQKPVVQPVAAQGASVQSVPVAASSAAAVPAATPSIAATPVASDTVPASPQPSLPTIDALKVLWDSATTAEKKEFLKWAFQ